MEFIEKLYLEVDKERRLTFSLKQKYKKTNAFSAQKQKVAKDR